MGLIVRRWALIVGLVLVCSAWALQQGPSDGELWKVLAGLFAAALTAIVGLMLRDAKRGVGPPGSENATARMVQDAIDRHEERERKMVDALALRISHEVRTAANDLILDMGARFADRVGALKDLLDEREKRYDERKDEIDARHAAMLRMLDDLGRRLP